MTSCFLYRRREFITLLGGAAAAWPLAARAQQPAMPVVGFLHTGSSSAFGHLAAAFREGLKDVGYVEGQNVAVEYRWAEGQGDRLPALAADLVHRQVAVIAATGGNPSAIAARAATTTIPIVFQAGSDPIEAGLVPTLNRPAGNTTGVSIISPELTAKRLEVLHETIPTARTIAFLVNPRSVNAEQETREVQAAARALGHQIHVLNVTHERDFDAAFIALTKEKDGALIVASDPLLTGQRGYLVALAAQHSVPAIYPFREFAAVGGLMSFGASISDAFRQVGIYTGRILKGQRTTDLPVQLPTKFEFVINLKTAKALALDVPASFYWRADEVIE
jgi:putative ABC transport system substrate-binding protein